MAESAKQFTCSQFPYLPVQLQVGIYRDKINLNLEVLFDTGFDGGIAIPRNITNLEKLPSIKQTWTLADGTDISVPVYAGYVQIGHLEPIMTIIIILGDQPLIGRQVISKFKALIDHGKKITLII